jgi:hypothetical protein
VNARSLWMLRDSMRYAWPRCSVRM